MGCGTVENIFDPVLPESVKKTMDKLIPEDVKHSDVGAMLYANPMVGAAYEAGAAYKDTGGGGEENLPEVPSIGGAGESAASKVQDKYRAIKAARTKTVFSNFGLGDFANLARKYLLGE